MALPIEIYRSEDLLAAHERIIAVRTILIDAFSKIQTGAYSIKTALSDTEKRLQDSIREVKTRIEYAVVPKDVFSQFVNGDVAFDDYASLELIEYYNGLTKLSLLLHAIPVALLAIADTPQTPIAPNYIGTGILDIIDDTEFTSEGSESAITEAEPSFSYHIVKGGETLQGIADLEYGDYTRWPQIARANNNLTDYQLQQPAMIGRQIKIPIPASTLTQSKYNMVFERFLSADTQKQIDRFHFGSDLLVVDKKLVLKGDSDVETTSGVPVVLQNVNARLNAPQGSLSPMSIAWGTPSLKRVQGVPFIVSLDRYLTSLEAQAASDPRVTSATIDRSTIQIKGDAIYTKITMRLLGGAKQDVPHSIPT